MYVQRLFVESLNIVAHIALQIWSLLTTSAMQCATHSSKHERDFWSS